MLQNMQKRLYLHVYISLFVYFDHGGQDYARCSVITSAQDYYLISMFQWPLDNIS